MRRPHATSRRTRAAIPALAVAAFLGSTALLAPGASATTSVDGLWYLDATGVAEAHQTTTGAGVTIALIDSEINPNVPDLVGTNLTVTEPSYCADVAGAAPLPAVDTSGRARHTTSMASLLVGTGAGFAGDPGVKGVAPDAHVTVYAQLHDDTCYESVPDTGGPSQAFADAVADGADIVVVPGATAAGYDVTDAIRDGVVVVAAGGNDGGLIIGHPAFHNGVIATGTTTADGSVSEGSSYGPELGLVAPGERIRGIDPTFSMYGTTTGSSNSSVITAGVIALAMSAHPDATSNQILQAVVRTTDGGVHEPARDDTRGYGALDVRQLLSVDPSTLPDVNPFIRTDDDAYPPAEDFGIVAEADADPTADTGSSTDRDEPAAQDEPEDGPNLLVTAAMAIAALLVVAAVTTTVLVLRRRSRTTTDQTHQHDRGQQHG